MPSSYDSAVRGSLKMKGGVPPPGVRKRKAPPNGSSSSENPPPPHDTEQKPPAKKHSSEAAERSLEVEANSAAQSASPELPAPPDNRHPVAAPYASNLTAAEKAFNLVRKHREADRAHQKVKMTHRQRMDQLNSNLAKLSEHFDIPKVGPG